MIIFNATQRTLTLLTMPYSQYVYIKILRWNTLHVTLRYLHISYNTSITLLILLCSHHLQCNTYIININKDTYTKYTLYLHNVTLLTSRYLTLLLQYNMYTISSVFFSLFKYIHIYHMTWSHMDWELPNSQISLLKLILTAV